MYDLKIPFVSDMVGECYGVREEETETSAGSIVGAFMKGVVVDGLGGTVEGVANLVADPLEAIGGVTKILAYPEETLPQIWDGVKEYWNEKVVDGTAEDRANLAGQAVFEIAGWLIGVGEAKAALSGAKAVDKAGDTASLSKIIPDKKVKSGGSGVKISEGKAGGVVDEIAVGGKGASGAKYEITWNKNINATQEVIQGTNIPKSFTIKGMKVNGNEVWVHGNATKHMGEFVKLAKGSIMVENELLLSFQDSLTKVLPKVQPGRNFFNIDGWEIGINGDTGVIYHALHK